MSSPSLPSANGPQRKALHTTRRDTISHPLPFLHPTRVEFHPPSETGEDPAIWTSRASRKSRYTTQSIKFVHKHDEEAKASTPVRAEPRVKVSDTQLKLHIRLDISFWVAFAFVFGSIAWVINGFLLFLPLLGEAGDNFTNAAAWAFIGGTTFEIGAYLQYIEAINSGHEQLFSKAFWGVIGWKELHPSSSNEILAVPDSEKGVDEDDSDVSKFRWWGTGDWHEIAIVATSIQLFAASIFWVSTLTGLPGVIQNFPADPPTAITDIFFWTPQILGGLGFIIASILFMIEVQKSIFVPNIASLGWHVGLWNLIGAVGFTLCAAFGYASLSKSWSNYQSILSTFWGGWAFLIGSTIQFWEVIYREPKPRE